MEEKRFADTFEIVSAFYINGKEIVFGIDEKKDYPYLVADSHDFLTGKLYDESYNYDNYLEALESFTTRLNSELDIAKTIQKESGITDVLSQKDCIKNSNYENYTNEVLVIDPLCLQPDKRTAAYQLVLAVGGFGCNKDSSGSGVMVRNIYNGKTMRFERQDVLGIIKPDKMPK